MQPMNRIASRLALPTFALVPALLAIASQQEPTAEQVYKDIEVFKGVPASDIIPAMQFMAASMSYKCTDCHVKDDYAADHKQKDEARKMVLMQREINQNHFNGRLEVTCMTCHQKKDHPVGTPLPKGVDRRHEDAGKPIRAQELFAGHAQATGTLSGTVVRTGTLTAPNESTHKVETVPLELIQAPGGKFRFVGGERKFGSDGATTWYGEYPMADEPKAIFNRIGRVWVGDADFKGLSRPAVLGVEKLDKVETAVVQGFRQASGSAEELYFDVKSRRLARLVNFRRSSIGTVVSAIDYGNYRPVGGAFLPMKVVVTFAEGEPWVMEFKSAKLDSTVSDSVFKLGG